MTPALLIPLAQVTPQPRGLGTLDWAVLGGYFALLVATGLWVARRRVTTDGDYFLAGRSMPTWAVAVSLLATAQSAATFIGAPQQSFRGDLSYLLASVGGLLAAAIIAWTFIPAYYRHGVWTPYELLERRFGRGARVATSWAYLVGRVFSNGARVFIGALPASLIIFGDDQPGHVLIGIAVMTVVSIVYTLAGGIRSAIWTDALQCVVYLGSAVVVIGYLLSIIPAGVPDILAALAHPEGESPSKLAFAPLGVDPSAPLGIDLTRPYTLITACTGLCLLYIAAYGTDQDFVQRTLTCRSAKQGARSVALGVLLQLPATLLFLVIGLLLWVFYRRPDIMGAEHAYSGDKTIFLQFILGHVPAGLSGLMIAGLFAAGLASVNAMSSAFVNDCYKHIRPDRSERHYLCVGRWAVVGFGIVLGLFACACVAWYDPRDKTLIDFALEVMSFAYAGLLGVFFTALFTRRGNSVSAVAALMTGFAVVALLQPAIWGKVTGWFEATRATPDEARFTLGDLRLAFPWQLVVGTVVATAVCCAAKGTGSTSLRRDDRGSA